MDILAKGFLLFGLNFLDAILTLIWVKNDVASEGNQLMQTLMEMGDGTFLLVKVSMGAIAVITFYNWSNLRVARFGLYFSLTVYALLMGVHALTGLCALGM